MKTKDRTGKEIRNERMLTKPGRRRGEKAKEMLSISVGVVLDSISDYTRTNERVPNECGVFIIFQNRRTALVPSSLKAWVSC